MFIETVVRRGPQLARGSIGHRRLQSCPGDGQPWGFSDRRGSIGRAAVPKPGPGRSAAGRVATCGFRSGGSPRTTSASCKCPFSRAVISRSRIRRLPQPVAIIKRGSVARRFWPNGSPLGRYVVEAPRDSNAVPVPREIVGIVAIVARLGRTEPTDQEVYIPQSQAGGPDGEMELLVRVDPGRRDIATAVGREILMTDPDVVVRRMAFLEEDIADFFAPQRSFLLYVGGFAVVALTLACMGVYGMTAYAGIPADARNRHSHGSGGASRGDVLTAVLRQGVKLTLIGLVVGLAGALAATRVIRESSVRCQLDGPAHVRGRGRRF